MFRMICLASSRLIPCIMIICVFNSFTLNPYPIHSLYLIIINIIDFSRANKELLNNFDNTFMVQCSTVFKTVF